MRPFNINNHNLNSDNQFFANLLYLMYSENQRLVLNLTDTIENINESNRQIRDLLTTLLVPSVTIPSTIYNDNTTQYRRNSYRNNFNQRTNPYVRPNANASNGTNLNANNRQTNNQIQLTFADILQTFLRPVEVFPTPSQIESATRQVRFCDIITPLNLRCPISMENFSDNDIVTVIRHCGHIFQRESLQSWFQSSCRCPVCRYDIRDYNPTQNMNDNYFAPPNNMTDNSEEETKTDNLEQLINRNNINSANNNTANENSTTNNSTTNINSNVNANERQTSSTNYNSQSQYLNLIRSALNSYDLSGNDVFEFYFTTYND